MSAPNATRPSRFVPLKRSFARGGLACALIVLLSVSGCRPRLPSTESSSAKKGDAQTRSTGVRLDQMLDHAMASLQPDRLGMSASLTDSVSALNDWAVKAAEESTGDSANAVSGEVPEFLAQDLPAGFVERMLDGHYSQRDALHLRDALLMKRMLATGGRGADAELARVVNIFDYVTRHLSLGLPAGEVPLSLYDAAMFGRGTAEHRGWLFAEILRQIPLDAFIIRASREGAPENAWVVGVPVGGSIYLFDPQLGLPIPADAAQPQSALVKQPATLQQVVEDPSLLQALAIDDKHPYPMIAEDFRKPRLEVIVTSTHAAPRTAELQKHLVGEHSARIYEALSDAGALVGAASRVLEAGRGDWSQEQVRIWPFPERQCEASLNYDDAQRGVYAAYEASLQAPVPIRNLEGETPQDLVVELGPPQWRLRKSRNAQVLGDETGAIRKYISIRVWGGFPPQEISKDAQYEVEKEAADGEEGELHRHAKSVFLTTPQDVRPFVAPKVPQQALFVHARAHEDAHFWTAMAQFESALNGREQRGFSAAEETLQLYATNFGGSGAWSPEMFYFVALSRIHAGKLDEATAILGQIPEKLPHYRGYQLLARRLKALQGGESNADNEKRGDEKEGGEKADDEKVSRVPDGDGAADEKKADTEKPGGEKPGDEQP